MKLILFGTIGLIVSIILAAVATSQLDTAMTTAGAVVNTMAGLSATMGIYGIIFWVAITGSALSMLGFGVYGTIRRSRSRRKSRKARRGA